MREETVVADSARKLQARAAQLAPNLVMHNVEVLIWPRSAPNSQQKAAPDAIIAQVQSHLTRAGYLYQQTARETGNHDKVREFVAVSRATKRIVPGFWMATDEFLLLGWGSFGPPDK